MSKKLNKTQKAGAWFNGDNSPLMIDSPIAPNLFQVIQTGGNQQRVQQQRVQQPRVQQQRVQQPRVQQQRVQQPRVQQPRVQQPRVQQPRVQQPRVQVQQQFPQPSRQVNETYASFNQQGGKQPRGCGKQTDKKYLTRASPPFPANECCGMTIVGNNSKPWISKANVNGICRWVEIKKE
jgi:hypothetical protein